MKRKTWSVDATGRWCSFDAYCYPGCQGEGRCYKMGGANGQNGRHYRENVENKCKIRNVTVMQCLDILFNINIGNWCIEWC